ncbi:putative isopropanol dehydrogenase [Aspergillus brunneoviolaceus CBS 621.78]|uniref:GroES-like protein n=1 Tax=Aspergillus brunneoviolaceus CBS 621.78 TaxID=1450534 RepID=A0ACD1GM70_9EURO|nr:GroES-like protein [Aspergillus brunneoviolaceus CBS 621.78]RAH50444.1 GroES-like protein [Aspergillus brunneoviolaceus CBS 621.78]
MSTLQPQDPKPETHTALTLHAHNQPLTLTTVPLPHATTGSAIVRILAASIVPYMAEILRGQRAGYALSLPLTPGNSAIGRIHATGDDAVALQPGQLVFIDITIRARDDPTVSMLAGVHGGGTAAAQRLMDGPWRHATYAEYARFPLENLFALDEGALLQEQRRQQQQQGQGQGLGQGLGYSVADLCLLSVCLVPFGGLAEVEVKPGEVVIVGPATGRYGGAAVAVALAMGATVVAVGRNRAVLAAMERTYAHTHPGRLRTVVMEHDGDVQRRSEALRAAAAGRNSRAGGADVYIDFSPPAADGSLLAAAVGALRPFGRCVIMGGSTGQINVPYLEVMFKSLRLQGRFMYDRQHVLRLIQMVESGLLRLGEAIGVDHVEEFGLESATEALEAAARLSGWGGHVVLRPCRD